MKLQALILTTIISIFSLANEKFPLRDKYPKIPTIEMTDLIKNYEQNVIVDVRSKFEFDTIHIEKAKHIPMSTSTFLDELEKLRKKDAKKTLVLYCNGVKCSKSFEAAEKAIAAGFQNVLVFDAGVLSWGQTQPTKTFLMGSMPADPKKIISDTDYKAKFVKIEKIKSAEADPGSVIYDVRDPIQRKAPLSIKNVKELPLDRITPLLKAGQFKDKTLYFIDAVGKQNEWLQYYLNEYGYKNYWFLEGGADGIK